MPDQNIIKRIQTLKQVKPNSDWVSFAKKDILSRIPEEEPSFDWRKIKIANVFTFPVLKPVAISLAVLIFFSVFGGTFWITKNTNPGDSFYSLKLTYQDARTRFLPQDQKPQMHLEYAYQRIEDLEKVTEEKKDDGVNETVKIVADDISKATNTFQEIKEPAKKFSAGMNLIKQASKIEKGLAKEKEVASSQSQEKISEVEKLTKETKENVFATLMKDSEENSDYRTMVENLQKEIEEYEKQYRESNQSN